MSKLYLTSTNSVRKYFIKKFNKETIVHIIISMLLSLYSFLHNMGTLEWWCSIIAATCFLYVATMYYKSMLYFNEGLGE